ncbi:bifunctional PIG-L family deacetylase/class I SAM-dependent methyltransferase [Aureimonas frigidaquae]|uniref:Methyltransferase domain-containing protein n=1 Tax=Aureimonas frigidaquae TaxID=424757 RepID=A0A0P0Z408_9HYPH|nr:bifunctional PIG-L family deacetylase/class I SAM-dependent methyltransferase [Aureimonas frigidaquae]BAT28824.1 hypothetical protein [Aureimonas frigidaquae]
MSTKGTYGGWTRAMDAAPCAAPGLLTGPGGLVVLSPHPDDETLGCSALIRDAAARRLPLGIVAVTDGEGSHRQSPHISPAELAAIRTLEQEAAVAELAGPAAQWLRLGLPDGASRYDSRWDDAIAAVEAFCLRLGATAVAAPHPDDPHPDHHATAEMVLCLRERLPGLRVLFYEIWSYRLGVDAPFRNAGLSAFRTPTPRDDKRRALACHRSQLGLVVPDSEGAFRLPDWFLKQHDGPLERIAWLDMPGQCPKADHFDRLYADGADPFGVRDRHYELEKRAASARVLARERYCRVLELGSGEAHLSRDLLAAGMAVEAIGVDRSAGVVAQAARDAPDGLSLIVGSLPDDLPQGRFDLILLPEILYYLSEAELRRLAARLPHHLTDDAQILIVSYRGPTDTPLDGIAAADFLMASLGAVLRPVTRQDHPAYRLDLLAYDPGCAEDRAGGAQDRSGVSAVAQGAD